MTHTPTCSQCRRPYASGPCTAPRPLTLGDPAPVPVSTEGTTPTAPPVPLRSGVFAARVRAVLLSALVVLAGCKPNLPPVSGCEPFRGYCVHDRIATCSASQRLHIHGDLPCARIGGVCAVRNRVARCETIDGGVLDDAPDATELDGGVLPLESPDAEVPDGD